MSLLKNTNSTLDNRLWATYLVPINKATREEKEVYTFYEVYLSFGGIVDQLNIATATNHAKTALFPSTF